MISRSLVEIQPGKSDLPDPGKFISGLKDGKIVLPCIILFRIGLSVNHILFQDIPLFSDKLDPQRTGGETDPDTSGRNRFPEQNTAGYLPVFPGGPETSRNRQQIGRSDGKCKSFEADRLRSPGIGNPINSGLIFKLTFIKSQSPSPGKQFLPAGGLHPEKYIRVVMIFSGSGLKAIVQYDFRRNSPRNGTGQCDSKQCHKLHLEYSLRKIMVLPFPMFIDRVPNLVQTGAFFNGKCIILGNAAGAAVAETDIGTVAVPLLSHIDPARHQIVFRPLPVIGIGQPGTQLRGIPQQDSR